MTNIPEYIKKNPGEVQRLIGRKHNQLQQLIQSAIISHNKKLTEIEKHRIIKGGRGRKVKLELTEQIILTLIYLRHLTTFQLLGIQFGVSETTANDTFNYWVPIWREVLPSRMLEQVKKTSVTIK